MMLHAQYKRGADEQVRLDMHNLVEWASINTLFFKSGESFFLFETNYKPDEIHDRLSSYSPLLLALDDIVIVTFGKASSAFSLAADSILRKHLDLG